MRYRTKGHEVKSENAAQSPTHASAYLINWLHNRERTRSALDFGCGKLRYTQHLACQSNDLGIADSEIQLTRHQTLDGQITTVKELVQRKWPYCRIHLLEDLWSRVVNQYEFVLFANVLSAIPCSKARARSLRAIYDSLTLGGKVLVVNQHTNSSFSSMRRNSRCELHLDGWLTHGAHGTSYYGILKRDSVCNLLKRYSFTVEDAWISGQSNYVLAGRN